MIDKNVIVYLDNIQIFTKTEEERRWIIAEVFNRLVRYSLFVNKEKYVMFCKYVEFLGYIITAKGTSVQAGKVEAVRNWP